jgi:hypothetical protein
LVDVCHFDVGFLNSEYMRSKLRRNNVRQIAFQKRATSDG